MSQSWHSLFLPEAEPETVISALRSVLIAHGYAEYDPFPGGTGTPPKLAATVRHFVSPVSDGWVRVLGEPDDDVLHAFHEALDHPVIVGWLTGEDGGFALLHGGERHDDPAVFADYLHPDHSPDTLARAFAGKIKVKALDPDLPPVAVLGAESLPPELQQFAQQQGVDATKANKLVERLGGKLLGRFSNDAPDAPDQAHAMLSGAGRAPDIWNSLDGQRVRAIASVLNLPDNWRLPTWQQVRDAYQVFRLRVRSPRMMLMPGDQEAMDAVLDALNYTPVYMGKPKESL